MKTTTRPIIKRFRFQRIQTCARDYWRELSDDPAIVHQTIRGKRLRAAVQQLMELADGEKPWVATLKRDLTAWKRTRHTVYKIPLAFNNSRFGGPKRRGDPYCYGIRLDWQDDRVIVSATADLRDTYPIGD